MKHSTRSSISNAGRLGVIAIALLAVGCSEQVPFSAPAAPEASATMKGVTVLTAAQLQILAQGLLRTAPLAAPVAVSKSVSNAQGGSIKLPNAGFELTIPAGALPGPTLTITVTALAGNVVAYDFQPHGTVFLKPLTFSQDIKQTSWSTLKLKGGAIAGVSGAYFANTSQVNLSTGVASVDELFPAELAIAKSRITFGVPHFSGYMVAMGRQ